MRELKVGMRGRVYGYADVVNVKKSGKLGPVHFLHGAIGVLISIHPIDDVLHINLSEEEYCVVHRSQFCPFKSKKKEKSKRLLAWLGRQRNAAGGVFESLYWFQEGKSPWDCEMWTEAWKEKRNWRRAYWLDEPEKDKKVMS